MYEETRRFSWTSLFIKVIVVVIFILFTVWLLSLATKNATKGMSDSLNVLTDNIFAQNVDRMKDVGKSYFTTERLPKKVGEVKKLSLARMYDEDLILEIKDKNGNACSAKNSYVTVEKMDTEYQMKVYLECGEEKAFIKVIMGCYNYCNTDICEKKEETQTVTPTTEPVVSKEIEYEYSKSTGGSWGPWGDWSEWSKEVAYSTSTTEVETKIVKENYTYEKIVQVEVEAGKSTCPNVDGYTLSSNNNGVCTYTKVVTSTAKPVACSSTYNGYTLVSQSGFTCTYSKGTTSTTSPESCPSTYNGYTLVSQNGFTCNYSKGTTSTTSPVSCPSTYNGYSLVSQNGFTCNYSKSTTSTANPASCPSTYNGYSLVSQNGFTCNYSKKTTSSVPATATTTGGDPITDDQCYNVAVGTKIVSSCRGCAKEVQTIYERRCNKVTVGYTPVVTEYSCPSGYTRTDTTCYSYGTATTTTTVGCPSGYSKSGNSCAKTGTETAMTTVGCPSGYSKSGNTCVKSGTTTTTTTVGCPSGYSKSGNTCVKSGTTTTTTTVGCPSGYTKKGSTCTKETISKQTRNASCPSGQTLKNGKCYKTENRVETVTGVKDVTYYRFRTRTYIGGTIDYKWSRSNNDSSLINAGYRLTGKTRTIGGK